MIIFYDLNDNPVTTFRFKVYPESLIPMSLKVECFTGKKLYCSAISNLNVRAKHESDVIFTDLLVDGLDLSPWDGQREIFDIEFESGAISAYVFRKFHFFLG